MGLNPQVVELHVEHLELDGVDPRDGAAVVEALQAGLARHFGGAIQWEDGAHVASIDAGAFRWDGRAETLGSGAADAIGQELTR